MKPLKPLRASVAVINAHLLLREGPAEYEDQWPRWNEGDTSGVTADERKSGLKWRRELIKEAADEPRALLAKLVPQNKVYQTSLQRDREMLRDLKALEDLTAFPT